MLKDALQRDSSTLIGTLLQVAHADLHDGDLESQRE